MKIKKLELCGFKSFKKKTPLTFSEGVTGVVGPNGCGKSNIVDALLWVMGETSAKHLRGSSMSDVIFSGTESSHPMAFAEVSLILENEGGVFPAKYSHQSEMMLTRRLYRSGESEYLINKEPVRLRDVQSVFMDTGAGTKGFSIIEQGTINHIISAKPEERKALIEEAAGLTQFKLRKKESERKLKATEHNLIRLRDILSEKQKQMKRLEKQVKKAEKYKSLKEKMKKKDLHLISHQFSIFQKKHQEKKEELKTLDQKVEEGASLQAGLEAKRENLKLQLSKKEIQMNEAQKNHKSHQEKLKEKENEIQELHFEIRKKHQNQENTTTLLEQQRSIKEKLLKDLEQEQKNVLGASDLFEKLDLSYKEKMEIYHKTQEHLVEIEEELSDKRKVLLELSQERSKVQTEVTSLKSQKEEGEKRGSEFLKVLKRLKEQGKECSQRLKDLSQELKSESETQRQREKSLKTKEEQLLKIEQERQTHEENLKTLKENLTQTNERLESLKTLQAQFEGFQEGTRHLLIEQKKSKEESVFFPLADLIEVSPKYDKALESSLSSHLQLLFKEKNCEKEIFQKKVLKSLKDLKENQRGRSSFFLGDEEKKNPLEDFENSKTSPLLLSQVIHISESISQEEKNFILSFLSQFIVSTSLEEALSLKRKHPRHHFVTLEGELLTSTGILSGGGEQGSDLNLFRRKHLIKDLSYKKEELMKKTSNQKELFQTFIEKEENLKKEIEEIVKTNHSHNILIAELTKDQERLEGEESNLRKAYESQKKEKLYYENQVQTLTLKIQKTEFTLKGQQKEQEELKIRLESLDQELKNKREEADQVHQEVTQLQIESAAKELEKKGFENEIKRLEKSLKELDVRYKNTKTEWEENESSLLKEEKNWKEEKEKMGKNLLLLKEKEKFLSLLKKDFDDISSSLQKLENSLSDCFRQNHQNKIQSSEVRLKSEELKLKMEALQHQVMEKYNLEISAIFSQYDKSLEPLEEVEKDFERLKSQLTALGEVYLLAIEEYQELKKSSDFFSDQYEKLIQAKNELEKVIEHIDRICHRRFRDSFHEVNEKFSKVFPTLFGGGSAQLILLEKTPNEEGGEEAGIDIEVQPPGKKLRNIKLLSGGEKALTASALMFSLFLLKPSPFCILDEVDAPLDDTNVFRFNTLIQEMSQKSQIIIVTHNKYTMRICQFLFGVTMEEKGISKMISVQLDLGPKEKGEKGEKREEQLTYPLISEKETRTEIASEK